MEISNKFSRAELTLFTKTEESTTNKAKKKQHNGSILKKFLPLIRATKTVCSIKEILSPSFSY